MKNKIYLVPSILLESYYFIFDYILCKSYDFFNYTNLHHQSKSWRWKIREIISYNFQLNYMKLLVLFKILIIKVITKLPDKTSIKLLFILLNTFQSISVILKKIKNK